MPLAFRNVTTGPDDPVTKWPTEAVQAALERGDLEHWGQLAAEIRREPWAPTSRQVEEVLNHSRPYGVAELMASVIGRARHEPRMTSERASRLGSGRRLPARD